mgnify:CR=1 FL=1
MFFIYEVNHDPLMIAHQTGVYLLIVFEQPTNKTNQQDIDFSIGVICSYFHEMYVLSGMTGCEQVDSFK